jgi:hypothetical protein
VSSTGAPQPDGALNKTTRIKIRHYRQIYENRSDPIVFLPVVVNTSGHVYEDFTRLLFLHTHREVRVLAEELPEGVGWVNFAESIGHEDFCTD